MFAWTELRHPVVTVPDPSERLIGTMRDYVTAKGATFLVGPADHRAANGLFSTCEE